MATHPELEVREIEKIYQDMDIDHSGEVDYMEFLSATIASQRGVDDPPSMMAAFAVLDEDNDGYVTKQDITKLLGDLYTEVQVTDMLGESGRLNFEQFKTLMVQEQIRSSQVSEASSSSSHYLNRKLNELHKVQSKDGPVEE